MVAFRFSNIFSQTSQIVFSTNQPPQFLHEITINHQPSPPVRRIFIFEGSQAGVFHVASRFLDRVYRFEDEESKDRFLKIVRAYEDLLGVEVLT